MASQHSQRPQPQTQPAKTNRTMKFRAKVCDDTIRIRIDKSTEITRITCSETQITRRKNS
jgi:hypothetical protein